MPGVIARRLFPILQLTRMALVFTAISNSLCTLLIATQWRIGPNESVLRHLDWHIVLAVVLISTGLYGFGMSLNDIIDRRRDQQISPNRPLPSGRIGIGLANFTCGMLFAMALFCGLVYAKSSSYGWMSLVLVMWTAMLIVFYDFAAKYLVALGLLSLGLIRFFHAVIPAPQLPLVWHPLLLLNHVTLLSLVAYRWEEKRPLLTRNHLVAIIGGVLAIDTLLIGLIAWRRAHGGGSILRALRIEPALIAPAAAVIVFIILAWLIRKRSASPREAGQRLMLYGLLWLIVYDFTFAAGYVGLLPAGLLLMLLPLAYVSVQVMRWWGGVLALSQRPQFKRIEV